MKNVNKIMNCRYRVVSNFKKKFKDISRTFYYSRAYI